MKDLGLELEYCPVCGNHRHVRDFLENLRLLQKAVYKDLDQIEVCIPEIVTDENGNKIIYDRSPQHGVVKSYTAPDMSVDLDKIDISRELGFLKMKGVMPDDMS